MARVAVANRVASTRGNLLANGDFEIAPPFVAAQTASNWIDGTAAGTSVARTAYKWRLLRNVAAIECEFDTDQTHSGTHSLRLSTTDATGRGLARLLSASNAVSAVSFGIPVFPSSTYVVSAWLKMNNARTSGTKGQWVRYTAAGATIGSNFSLFTATGGTQDWTFYSTTVTTGATDAFMDMQLLNDQAGNISDIWFDEVTIKPLSTGRSAASGRVAV